MAGETIFIGAACAKFVEMRHKLIAQKAVGLPSALSSSSGVP